MKQLSILFFIILVLVGEASYSQNSQEAKELTDSAKVLGMTKYSFKHKVRWPSRDSLYRNKISLLNEAIHIDSNYFEAFYYKFLYLNQLKDDRNALPVAKKALQLRPNATNLKYEIGLAYDRIGDSVSARPYYQDFLTYCNAVLDTMPTKDKQRIFKEMDKINVLILLGEKEQSRKLVKKAFRHRNDDISNFYYTGYMKMTRAFILKNRTILAERNFEPD